jgi:hypothetical protein
VISWARSRAAWASRGCQRVRAAYLASALRSWRLIASCVVGRRVGRELRRVGPYSVMVACASFRFIATPRVYTKRLARSSRARLLSSGAVLDAWHRCHDYTRKGPAEGVEGVSEAKSGWSAATVAE